jgi:hypothetical protein
VPVIPLVTVRVLEEILPVADREPVIWAPSRDIIPLLAIN